MVVLKNPLQTINKLPPKTRNVVLYGAVAGGAFLAYRRWNSAEEVDTSEPASTADTTVSDPATGGTPAPIYVVGSNGSSDDGNSSQQFGDYFGLFQGLADTFTGATNTALETFKNGYETTLAAKNQSDAGWQNVLLPIITSRSEPPTPATIIVNPATIPAEAPAPPAPVVQAPAATSPATQQGPPGYPHYNPAKGTWYKNVKAGKNGTDSNGNKYKKGDDLNVYYGGAIVKDN